METMEERKDGEAKTRNLGPHVAELNVEIWWEGTTTQLLAQHKETGSM
jgi:hypothetical protein